MSKAESTLEEAFKLIHNQKPINELQLGAAYVQMGVLNRRKAKHTTAAEYYLKALDIFKSYKDSLLISDVYHIGMLYRHQKENEKTILYYRKFINVKEKIKDTHVLGAGYNMMGVSYRYKKR